jgi:3,4-dihydroxy 2-butanone 4-phosphate synthase/GTP cyclohydrolase II
LLRWKLGAQILLDIGVGKMTLLTSSKAKLAALEGFGLKVTGRFAFRDVDPVQPARAANFDG